MLIKLFSQLNELLSENCVAYVSFDIVPTFNEFLLLAVVFLVNF